MASGTPVFQVPGMMHANPTNIPSTGAQSQQGKKKKTKGTHKPLNLKKSTVEVDDAGQASSSPAEPIYWERFPHLTDSLLSWLLSHPADRTILFYDRRATQESGPPQEKASGRHKKDIHAAIAQHLFSEDVVYSRTYASGPDRFASAVQSRLVKYVHFLTVFILILTRHLQFEREIPYPGWQTQIDWCWSGPWRSEVPKPYGCVFLLSPLLPHFFLPFYSEEICASFPHFVECHEMWHGNPSYDAPTFNSSSTTNRANDFLALVQQGVATKPAQQSSRIRHEPTDETEGDNGGDGMPGSEDAKLLGRLNIGPKMGGPSTTDIDMMDVDQMEEEEEEEEGGGETEGRQAPDDVSMFHSQGGMQAMSEVCQSAIYFDSTVLENSYDYFSQSAIFNTRLHFKVLSDLYQLLP